VKKERNFYDTKDSGSLMDFYHYTVAKFDPPHQNNSFQELSVIFGCI